MLKENKIKDPFQQDERNRKFLSWKWTNLVELFNIINKQNVIVDIETQDDIYSGKVIDVNDSFIELHELDNDFRLSTSCIKVSLQEIFTISLNFAMSDYINQWQKVSLESSKSELVEIYFDYENENRKESFLLGRIIEEEANSLLVETITEDGLLDSYTLVNKKWVSDIRENSIKFYDYLIEKNKNNGTFNQNGLKVSNDALTIRDAIQNFHLGQIITVNNIAYTSQNIGILKKKNQYGFTIQNFDNYRLAHDDTFNYDSIASVDLDSNDYYFYKVLN